MRPDFIKVLTERPRAGGDKYRSVRSRGPIGEDESAPRKQGMEAPHRERKEFTDLLGPLYKFLQSRVGKPWSKVHSEICEHLKGRSTQQQHLLDHLKRAVEDKLEVWPDKTLHEADGRAFSTKGGTSWRSFYVDPRDGILKAVKQGRSWRRNYGKSLHDPNEFKLVDGRTYKRLDGIWYQVEIVKHAVFTGYSLQGVMIYRDQISEARRQLGTKELKNLGLSNDYLEMSKNLK